jgi:hypothetical protein
MAKNIPIPALPIPILHPIFHPFSLNWPHNPLITITTAVELPKTGPAEHNKIEEHPP